MGSEVKQVSPELDCCLDCCGEDRSKEVHAVRQRHVEERGKDKTDTESDRGIVTWPDKAEVQAARVGSTEHPRKADGRGEGLGVPEQRRSNCGAQDWENTGSVRGRNGD